MAEIEALIREYARQCTPITAAEFEARLELTLGDNDSTATESFDGEVAAIGSDVCESCGADLTVFDLQVPDDGSASPPRKRRAAVLAVAAALLLVVGVVVVPDRNDRNVETEPATSATTPDAVSSPTGPEPTPEVYEPGPFPSVVDSFGYRWSEVPHDEPFFGSVANHSHYLGSGDIRSVTAGGPGFVAVGSRDRGQRDSSGDAAVWTSVDGITWSPVPHDEAILGRPGFQAMTSVTTGGPGLVAVGGAHGPDEEHADAAVWTSVDGLAWSRVPHDEAVFGGNGESVMTSVTTGGPGLVAVGFQAPDTGGPNAAVWTSADGLAWSRVPHDEAVFGGNGESVMTSVTTGGPGFVAVGARFVGRNWDWAAGEERHMETNLDVAVWTSVDGLTWAQVPHDEEVFGGSNNQFTTKVIEGGPGLVAVGGDFKTGDWDHGRGSAAVWTSVDGLTWSRVPHTEAFFGETAGTHSGNGAMLDITATEPGLLAGGWAGVWTSVDGLTWSFERIGGPIFGVADIGSSSNPANMALGRRAAWVATPEN